MIKYFHEMKKETVSPVNRISISNNWLGGFVDGDGCFSCSSSGPIFRLENHIKELELFKKIKEYLNSVNLSISKPRSNRINSNSTCVLEIINIHILHNVIIPIFSVKCEGFQILQSKKLKDFNDWFIVVKIYYNGYHILAEGISLINDIKSNWNNFRLSTNKIKSNIDPFELENKLNYLFSLPAPYEIKNGVRLLRGTNNFVSEKLPILCLDQTNNKLNFSSITECSKALKIDRSTIKKYLITGEFYKSYKFIPNY
ncbi:unnamed protein product [Somion occarium]|uniref:LAGLIDADG homing endonuclease n=1 Tax=Somion occarium TaxID=3059160 RepID=A0ABP1DDC6_9APHY